MEWPAYEICSKLTASERRHWRSSGVFIVNFEQISYIFLVFPSEFQLGFDDSY